MARLKRWFSKKTTRSRLPGSRPEHEIRQEVERDLQRWRDKLAAYGEV